MVLEIRRRDGKDDEGPTLILVMIRTNRRPFGQARTKPESFVSRHHGRNREDLDRGSAL